jgi:hypothetical protein
MPRLVGKKNDFVLYASLGFLFAAIAAVSLEYFGVIDYIPNFGKESKVNSSSTNQPLRINKPAN